jgi:two-component system NtrC family sensor kinase
MRRRSGAGGESIKGRRQKAVTLKRRDTQKPVSTSRPIRKAEVARLTRELKDARERQAATSEVLRVISRSKFELQPVLQSVMDTAARLCRAEAAIIFRLENGYYRFAAGYSLDPSYSKSSSRL